jgi:hypothetical protein
MLPIMAESNLLAFWFILILNADGSTFCLCSFKLGKTCFAHVRRDGHNIVMYLGYVANN